MKRWNKWLVGGAVAAGALGVAAWILSDDGKTTGTASTDRALTRDEIVSILKELNREVMGAFITLASFAASIKEQTGGKIKESDLKEILISQSPLLDQIKKAETKVYQKYQTNEAAVKRACKHDFKSDEEIQALQARMKSTMDRAFVGQQPEMSGTIPSFMTPELTLQILDTMYRACRKVAFQKMEGLRALGIPITPMEPRVIKATQEMEAEAEQAKQKVYKRFGIDCLEESASLILHNAVQKFSEANQDFVFKVSKIEREYKMKMAMMMEGGLNQKEKEELMMDSDDEGYNPKVMEV